MAPLVRQLEQFYRLYDPSQLPIPIDTIAYYTPPAELTPSLISIAHQEQEQELNLTLRAQYGVDLSSMCNYLQQMTKATGGSQFSLAPASKHLPCVNETASEMWAMAQQAPGGGPLADLI
jgi:hypothetical protein